MMISQLELCRLYKLDLVQLFRELEMKYFRVFADLKELKILLREGRPKGTEAYNQLCYILTEIGADKITTEGISRKLGTQQMNKWHKNIIELDRKDYLINSLIERNKKLEKQNDTI